MNILSRVVVFVMFMLMVGSAYAVDSYRYAHVTIETPWAIFLFLLVIILLPFILMAILYWHFALKKSKADQKSDA